MLARGLRAAILAAVLGALAGSIAVAQQPAPSPVPDGDRVYVYSVGIEIWPGNNVLSWHITTGAPPSCRMTAVLRREGASAPLAALFSVEVTGDDVRSGEMAIGHLPPGRYEIDVTDTWCGWEFTPATR